MRGNAVEKLQSAKCTSPSWFDDGIVESSQNDSVDNTPYFASPRTPHGYASISAKSQTNLLPTTLINKAKSQATALTAQQAVPRPFSTSWPSGEQGFRTLFIHPRALYLRR